MTSTKSSEVSSIGMIAVTTASRGSTAARVFFILKLCPRNALLKLARNRNKTPLPKPVGCPGIPLPPEEDTLISPNYQLVIPKKQPSQAPEEKEEEEEAAAAPSSSQELKTDMPQNIPQRVSLPVGPKRRADCNQIASSTNKLNLGSTPRTRLDFLGQKPGRAPLAEFWQ
ncbi:hypothetical protein Cgig2_009035 [Carnegiea gigantea]|uniref:Uncharacterized protein n=1 Tax=Carnegiea gigantea TaxID=171969 RepID=A0A9Q1KF68_9CARY|nr:hypothetical protein Cgig2_009035 [Carnegiea gigantea]